MMVAAAGSASVTTPPSETTPAPLATEWVAVAATARPARLDAAIWLKMPPWPASDASGAAAARLVGSAAASVLIPISGAAWVQPCGTDMLPTRAARPIDPDTGPAPKAALRCGVPNSLASGANAPVMGFGPARKAAAPCPFWPQAYPCPKDRNGPPGMDSSPWMEYGPEVMVEKMVFQFVRSAWSPGGNVAEPNCGNESPDKRFPDAVVGDSVRPVARFCSAVGSELISWVNCVPMFDALEVLVAWVAARPTAQRCPRCSSSAAAR